MNKCFLGPIILLSLLSLFGQNPAWSARPMPTDADSIRQLRCRAIECQLKGDKEAALSLDNQALNLASRSFGSTAPYLADIHYDIGVLALSDSNFNKAEESFNSALRLNPNSYPARIKLAELMNLRGHPNEALRQSQLVLIKHRENTLARQALATSYQNLDNPYLAIRECNYLSQAIHGKMPPAPVMAVAAPRPVVAPPAPDKALATDKEKAEKDKKAKAEQKKIAKQNLEKREVKAVARKPIVAKKAKPPASIKPQVKKSPGLPVNSEPEPESESDSTAEASAEAVIPKSPPVKKRRPQAPPAYTPSPISRRGGALVPPPPPVVPVYTQMPAMMAPMPKPVKAKTVEKVKEKTVESAKDDKPAAAEDDDFLLDWGGAKKKK